MMLAVIHLFALNHVTAVVHVLMHHALVDCEASVIVSLSCTCRQNTHVNVAVIGLVICGVVWLRWDLIFWCNSTCWLTPSGLGHVLLRKLCQAMWRALSFISFRGRIKLIIWWFLLQTRTIGLIFFIITSWLSNLGTTASWLVDKRVSCLILCFLIRTNSCLCCLNRTLIILFGLFIYPHKVVVLHEWYLLIGLTLHIIFSAAWIFVIYLTWNNSFCRRSNFKISLLSFICTTRSLWGSIKKLLWANIVRPCLIRLAHWSCSLVVGCKGSLRLLLT